MDRSDGHIIMGLSAFAMMNTEVHWAGDYPLALRLGYVCGKVVSFRHKKQLPLKLLFLKAPRAFLLFLQAFSGLPNIPDR
jgi:hypothetical protein